MEIKMKHVKSKKEAGLAFNAVQKALDEYIYINKEEKKYYFEEEEITITVSIDGNTFIADID